MGAGAGQAGEIEETVRKAAAEVAAELGLEVVEIVVRRSGRHSLVRVDVDRPGAVGVSIEDCARMTRTLSPRLDASGLLEFQHTLEVSSPGTLRPIRTDDDIRRNVGRRVVVETREPVDGIRVVRGVLRGASGQELRVETAEGREVLVPRELVTLARQDVELGRTGRA